ncbi:MULTISPECIES: hypothetical protein [unclassified Ensifer]|uniref:hypothetical protein n=1 Tax=unclassified Ensifer TaxID=2633371 RepID=UPI00300F9899
MPKRSILSTPKRTGLYPHRDLDCQLAIEDVFQTLAERAEAAGWTDREVANALIELAHNHWFALDAKDRMFEEAAGAIIRKANPSAIH